MATIKFPKNFLWGAATSAHQVEGGMHNDWSVWEKEHAHHLAQEAPSKFGHIRNWERFRREATTEANYISGKAADHYHRFREDFDLAQSLHHNAHRFSLEWSRIEPEEGKFDEEAINHYKEVIRALRERNIEPLVTLWHWSNPLWIRDIGDWSNKDAIDHYARYVEKVVQSFKDDVRFWIPVNEPSIHTSLAYIKGTQPPGKKSILQGLYVFHNILKGHKRAYEVIHKYQKDAQVGLASSIIHFEPKNGFFLNKIVAFVSHHFWNVYILKYVKNQSDFFGLNYYSRKLVGLGSNQKQQGSDYSDLGWEIFPEGIYFLLKNLSRLGRPIYITENGLADADDSRREKFIRGHLSVIHKAIDEGADVRGYFHWSLLDNNEFVELRGFWPRFGLIAVDYTTQARTVRPSALAYAKICQENALEEENT